MKSPAMISTSDKSRHTSTVILSEIDGRLQEVAKASSLFFKESQPRHLVSQWLATVYNTWI